MHSTRYQLSRRALLPALGLALVLGALGMTTAAAHAEPKWDPNPKPGSCHVGFDDQGDEIRVDNGKEVTVVDAQGRSHRKICLNGSLYEVLSARLGQIARPASAPSASGVHALP